MKNFLIVEDHAIVSLGMQFLIQKLFEPAHVEIAINFPSAIKHLQTKKFDLVILDINIAGGENTRMIASLRTIQQNIKILVFSGMQEQLYAVPYLQAGANGFLSKGASEEEYETAIREVLANDTYINSNIRLQMMTAELDRQKPSVTPLASLSQRELEVMHLLVLGKWTKEIAVHLNLKETTISTYKARILEKFNVDNVIDLFKKLESYK